MARTSSVTTATPVPALQAAGTHSSYSLLRTKILIPALPATIIARPALIARLDTGQPVTVVAAPAGSGKTTLLAQWAAGQADKVAWLLLDELDNDLPRFLVYLIAAIHDLDALTTHTGYTPEVTVTAALNALTAAPLALVLDNYQAISNAAIHDVVTFIINHLPPHARLIIAGRTHPPLALARLRSSRQLEQIDDLSFTPDDAAALLGLAPDDETARILTERTGGWVAGLQLAALWHEKSDDPRGFSGAYRYLYDYFIEEVVEPQPATLKNFLLHTSILDPLYAEVCNALTGHADGQVMLERLEQLNLFITPLDDLRRLYRYQPLFAEFLREWLKKQPISLTDLHLKASLWYEAHDQREQALDHALAARDWERASAIIERLAAGGIDVSRWTYLLPDELRAAYAVVAEPLSERETEVLHLISHGLSNPEIASRLIIAVSTVKTHVKNIYRKLDVDSRYEAMQRAREHDLLSIRLEQDYRRLIQ